VNKHYYSFEFVIMVESKVVNLTIMYGLLQKQLTFYHVYVLFGLTFDILLEILCEKCSPWKGL
jgi:hypothetical protein